MKNPGVRRSLDGLVFLATPFLLGRRRKLPALVIRWSVAFLVFMVWDFYGQWPQSVSISLGAFTALYAFVLRRVLFARAPKIDVDDVERMRDELVARGVLDDVNELSFAEEELPPILMLRPSADEASGLLRTSQFVTWSLGMVLGGVAQAFGLLLTLAVGLRWLSQNVGWIPDWIASFDFNPAFGIVLGLACILVVLLVTQQLLFAFDAAHRFADIEIIAEDAPPGVTAQIQVLRPRSALTPESARRAPSCLSRFFPKLAHTGIYDRPETPKEIAAWAKTLVSPRVSAVSTR